MVQHAVRTALTGMSARSCCTLAPSVIAAAEEGGVDWAQRFVTA